MAASIAASSAGRSGQRSRRRATPLIAYLDTSALIKALLEEEGSRLADEIWARSSRRVASRLVYPEARAALAAAHRDGRIDQTALRATIGDLDAACDAMVLIGVDWPLARHAGELAEQHALRGYDAVHLATALATDAPDLALVTWDRDLASAALKLGITIIPSLD